MFPLLLSALCALVIIIERAVAFRNSFATPPTVAASLLSLIENQNWDQALKICEQSDGPMYSVLSAGIKHFDSPQDVLELAMKNQAEAWVPRIEKRIDILDTIITAAPLMGLLGTITGMMASFQVLSEKGVNEPNAITGGVAEALIATATGLVIALFCLVAYNFFTQRMKTTLYQLECTASRLLEIKLAREAKASKAAPLSSRPS